MTRVLSRTMTEHWEPLPGWHPGRRMWAFYLTFPVSTALQRHVRGLQDRLADIPQLDLIKPDWVHLTIQGTDFADAIEQDVLEQVLKAARAATDGIRVEPFEVQDVVIGRTAIFLPAAPVEPLAELRNRIRVAAGDVLGREPVDLPRPISVFVPHVSIAYSNADVDAQQIVDRLPASSAPVMAEDVHLDLVRVGRDDRMWAWDDSYPIIGA